MVINMLWARIDDGRVIETTELDPEGRFPLGVYNWQPCPEDVQPNWSAQEGHDGQWVFAPYASPPPTQEEIYASNQQYQRNLLIPASQELAIAVATLNLGDPTESEVLLAKQWQSYYRDLKDIDLTSADPEWPTPPPSTNQ